MSISAPTLPHPYLINGLNHIPPPPVSSFDSQFSFAGLLPAGTSLPSSWGTTRYYDFSPAAPPTSRRVLIVHGGGTCAIGVAPFARLLTDAGNHVVIYDLWGHGLSSTPLETHSPALMHAQIMELLLHLGWTKVNLIGFSLGGAIVVSFSAIHQKTVESVVGVAPAGLWRKSERSWWDTISMDGYGMWGLEWWRRSRVMAYINGSKPVVKDGWKEKMIKGEVDTVPIQQWEIAEHKGYEASLTSTWNYVSPFDQHESYAKLNESGIKVLILLGEKDGVIEPEQSKKELDKMGWKGDVVLVKDATHELIRVQRKEVATLCSEFWGKL
ncbi:alpha/beta-hydrolase [Mollisia scopiformis]|uniref:Alpha/beta-hydrolase n=1 Tax=Mollisia scopiformis TaxID=149040 RepID=A0A194WVC5_MOLSC|nr:alpha/beta-hydrolase [Mollisia scopiformis]KUJ11916.1 alpha/beta-hydrolase [Mollisia scopiformis]